MEEQSIDIRSSQRLTFVVRALVGIAISLTVLLAIFLWHTSPSRRLRIARRRSKRRFVAGSGGSGGVGEPDGSGSADAVSGGFDGSGGSGEPDGSGSADAVSAGGGAGVEELEHSRSKRAGQGKLRTLNGSARFNHMTDGGAFDPDAMIKRFRERAAGVKRRNLPPVAGEERTRFLKQAQTDFQDFSIIGDAEVSVEDGILHLTVDLRPPETSG